MLMSYDLKMVHRNFFTLLKCRTKCCRFILLIIACICILIFIQHKFSNKAVSRPKEAQNGRALSFRRENVKRRTRLKNRLQNRTSSADTLIGKQLGTNLVVPHNSSHNTTILNDIIDDRLRSHAEFYATPSPSCNATEKLTVEQSQHFKKMAQALSKFRQQSIPSYSEDYFKGRGIVLTIGVAQISQCKVNLKMIERTKTRLPVQIWYSSSEVSYRLITELLYSVSKLQLSACSFTTAQCRNSKTKWTLNSTYVFSPSTRQDNARKHFPYKPAAILSSTFAEVLFLDSDSYLVRDPEYLFLSDPMYLQFGALFFSDALMSGQFLAVWKLLNTTCTRDEPEVDSGALLLDKKRVWHALYITKLMNDQYNLFYKWFSGGDKDTFRLAFRFLDVKYYMVGIPCSTGVYKDGFFCGFTMCKTDSMGKHIFINHFSLMKYVNAGYSSSSLGYTRIGLGDSYNHPFYMQYCPFSYANSCIYVDTLLMETATMDRCKKRPIDKNEIDNHAYTLDEPLMEEQFQNDRMLMSETNNLMPGFIDALFSDRQQVYGDGWGQTLEH